MTPCDDIYDDWKTTQTPDDLDDWAKGYEDWRKMKDLANKNYPKERENCKINQKCDCGGKKAKTTHALWCCFNK